MKGAIFIMAKSCMKKLIFYYIVQIALNIALIVIFYSKIILHTFSIVPILLIGIMLTQRSLLKINKKDCGDTGYSVGDVVRLTDEERENKCSIFRHSFLFFIPFELPFVFLLPSYLKLLCLIPFVLAFVVAGVVFKIKYGKQIKDRLNKENIELEAQKKREEMGIK